MAIALMSAAGVLIALSASAEQAVQAAAAVDRFHGQLLQVMQRADSLGCGGRYRELEAMIDQAFNLRFMTRASVGPRWKSMTETQQQGLVDAFSQMTIATYASRFDGFSGQSFKTVGVDNGPRNTLLVRTQLVRPNDDPVVLNYLIRTKNNDNRIIDIFLKGSISELATRRADYGATLRDEGAEALIQKIRAKVAAINCS